MKKYNISRKNKTHKKYNNTLFRRINKHFNLTRTMKGGGVKKGKKFIPELETLLENIKNDKTIDALGSPIYGRNRTKENDIQYVNSVLSSLMAKKTISDSIMKPLERYIYHYTRKKEYENEKNPNI